MRYLLQASSLFFLLSLTSFASQAQTSKIGALVSAQVTAVHVKAGQKVQAGDPLIDLDARRWQAQVKQAQAELKIAQLTEAEAKIELDQALDLFDRSVSARRALDRAKLDFALAEQKTRKAEAKLEEQQSWQPYFYIKAPRSGMIKKIHIAKGSTVFEENTLLIEIR